jgi:tetratricopeptide (TPR) repeat protein
LAGGDVIVGEPSNCLSLLVLTWCGSRLATMRIRNLFVLVVVGLFGLSVLPVGLKASCRGQGKDTFSSPPIDREKVMREQETRAQQYSDDRGLKYLLEKYPSRNRKVLELFSKGAWLCANNGLYDGTEKEAPTEDLQMLAFERGLEYINQAIQIDPTFPQLYLALGEYLHNKAIRYSNNHLKAEYDAIDKEALAAYREAVKLAPSDPDGYFGVANTIPGTNLDERIHNLLIIEKLDPKYHDLHCYLAESYEGKGNLEKATHELLECMDEPGNRSEAVDDLERLTAKSKQYSILMSAYLNLVDDDPSPYNYAKVYSAISGTAKDKKEKKNMLSFVDLESHVPPKVLAKFLVKVGSIAIDKWRVDSMDLAIDMFKKAIAYDPSESSAILMIVSECPDERVKNFAGSLRK